ncbi:MAG TPA: glutamate--tRNA ligase [Gemmataceae bacterium]|nr:glutamate--tRNA ligase [Gemmataceae bacterium]
MTMRTRFAPSPTGYLHIGGVRTALFNWLLTRQQGGQFVLRIDDTDAERNRPEALQPILDGFKWLGITWDEGPEVGGPYGPYFQSERQHLYAEAAQRLLDSGHAYPCYCPKEELDALRKDAEVAKRNFIHRCKCRNVPAADARRLLQERPAPLRLKVPAGRAIAIDDEIRGHVEWQTDQIGDPVIVRADGGALYNFATVVDDVAMKITHVIRAAEQLSNTDKQFLVYEALGAPLPTFAHVPLVFLCGKKMSKRDSDKLRTSEVMKSLHAIGLTDAEIATRLDLNPIAVAFYRELGYLPAALVNYLGRLGWSMDDKSEVIPLDQMIARFGLDRVNKAPGNFDPAKLLWLAGEYMRMLPLEQRVAGIIPFLVRAGLVSEPLDEPTRDKIRRVVEACGERIKIFSDILTYGATFFQKEPQHDAKAVEKKVKKAGAPEALRAFKDVLASAEPFAAATLEQRLLTFCTERAVNKNLLIHALRVATTGAEIGIGLYEGMVLLGRAETLRRIDMALSLV